MFSPGSLTSQAPLGCGLAVNRVSYVILILKVGTRGIRAGQGPGGTRASDVRCYECSARRTIQRAVQRDSGETWSSCHFHFIHQRRFKVEDSTPVDPAGGHRYRNSIKTCESRVATDSADCSVTRGERALKRGIISGN